MRWLVRICNPRNIDCVSLARFLSSYGLDLDRDMTSLRAASSIQMLFEPGCMQAYIDHCMPETNRRSVCQLLYSWHISCTTSRLEIMTAAVVRCFKSGYVTKEPNQDGMFHMARVVAAIKGDVDTIEETWPDTDVPGYVTLHRHRMHLFTLLNHCADMDVEKFQLLYVAAFGPPPPSRKRYVRPIHPHDARGKSIREFVNGIIANKTTEDNEKAKHCLQAEEMRKQLAKMNADCDVDMCEICMDKPIAVRFEPCQHHVCCDGCAALIEVCCICRAEICGRQVFIDRKDEEVEAQTINSAKPEESDHELYFNSICLLLEKLETGERVSPLKYGLSSDEKINAEYKKRGKKKGKKKGKK